MITRSPLSTRWPPIARWLTIPIAVMLAAAVLACGAKPPPPPVAEPNEPSAPPTSMEPASPSAEELETVPPPPPPPLAGAEAEGWADSTPPPAPERTTYGYRVQIFASANREGAESVAATAAARFPEPVVIEYEAPFHKVRVGNCVTRHEAERLKERALELGYDGSFIAETMVEVR